MCKETFYGTDSGETLDRSDLLPRIVANRMIYHPSDYVAQVVVSFPNQDMTNRQIELTLRTGRNSYTQLFNPCATAGPGCRTNNHVDFRVDLSRLGSRVTTLEATLVDNMRVPVSDYRPGIKFFLEPDADGSPNLPSLGISVRLLPQTALNDAAWGISTGIPIPKGARLGSTTGLVLYEDRGQGLPSRPVPAQFTNRATWDVDGDIKWLGLDFVGRYDGTIPRKYRLIKQATVPPAAGRSITVEDGPDTITVDTGVVKFRVSKKNFAGIERAWFDVNGNGSYSDPEERMIDGPGGPFLINHYDQAETDTIYKAALDPAPNVIVEEKGPVRATILATGWYVKETRKTGPQNLCRFITRIVAYAGQPLIRISDRTVLTYDTRDSNIQIKDIGWQVATGNQQTAWATGITAADGLSVTPFPDRAAPPSGQVAFVHQDRGDHVRVFENGSPIGEGSHSNGWLSAVGAVGRLTIMLRNMYQRFPKELELSNDPDPNANVGASGWAPRLAVHFWPKHGVDCARDPANCPFPRPEINIDPANFYKFRFAHQGQVLSLRIPDTEPENYIRAFTDYLGPIDDNDSDGGGGGEITGARLSQGQGLAIGGDFALLFQRPGTSSTVTANYAALFQDDPHALAEPSWNVLSEALGHLSAADPAFDPAAERALQIAMPGYRSAIADGIVPQFDPSGAIVPGSQTPGPDNEFGMWIYGNIHDNWDPSVGHAIAHRVWSNSHYQNVWQNWLLYFRSGDKAALKWARAASEEWEDVATVNYSDSAAPGRLAGYMYHVKGLVPWGGNSGIADHWINPSAYLIRYFLTGDRHGLGLAHTWEAAVRQKVPVATNGSAAPNSTCMDLDSGAETFPWINYNLRDRVNFLGELVDYYEATWSPQALLRIGPAASWIYVPLECTGVTPTWGLQWFTRYYDLTRNPVVIDVFKCWFDASASIVTESGNRPCSNYHVFNARGPDDNNPVVPTIRVCIEPATGTPCVPLASIFVDSAQRRQLPNPFQAEAGGNFFFYSNAAAKYRIQVSGNGFATYDIPNVTVPGPKTTNADYNVDAFLYRVTGDSSYLTRDMPAFYDSERIYYDNPLDRYHGYGPWVMADHAGWLQEAPYYLQAVKDAGMRVARGVAPSTYPGMQAGPARNVFAPQDSLTEGAPSGYPPHNWSNSGTEVLIQTDGTTLVQLSLSPSAGNTDPRGEYWVLKPNRDNLPPPPNNCPNPIQSESLYHQEYCGRSLEFCAGIFPLHFDFTPEGTAGGLSSLYRVNLFSTNGQFLAPYTDKPEASVMRRTFADVGLVPTPAGFFGPGGRQDYYFRTIMPTAPTFTLLVSGGFGKDNQNPVGAQPAYFRIETAGGDLVTEGTVFAYGSPRSRTVTLDSGSVYHFYSTTMSGHSIQLLNGADEMLLSTNLDHLNAISSIIPNVLPVPATCP
jgi:hypothetical protein